MMDSKKQKVILGGQALLPKGLFAEEMLQIIVEWDPETNAVMEVGCEPGMPVIEKLLRKLMIGINLETGINELRTSIENRLHHQAKKAVLAAITDLSRVYREYRGGGETFQTGRLERFKW